MRVLLLLLLLLVARDLPVAVLLCLVEKTAKKNRSDYRDGNGRTRATFFFFLVLHPVEQEKQALRPSLLAPTGKKSAGRPSELSTHPCNFLTSWAGGRAE